MLNILKNSIWKIYSDELVNSEHFSIINSLNEIVLKSGEHLEGNICYHDNTRLSYTNQKFDTKMSYSREYFRRCISYGTNFCEIGFNAGHSSSLILSENKKSKLLSLDIGHHKYTRPCMVFLKSYFNERFDFEIGDSVKQLHEQDFIDKCNDVDFIFIDGGHGGNVFQNDLDWALKHFKPGTYVLVDDIQHPPIANYCIKFLETKLKQIDFDFISNGRNILFQIL